MNIASLVTMALPLWANLASLHCSNDKNLQADLKIGSYLAVSTEADMDIVFPLGSFAGHMALDYLA